MTKFYNTNGIPTDEPTGKFWISEWNNNFYISINDNTINLDFKIIELSHKVGDHIFGSIQNFYGKLPYLTTIYSYGGVDAEINISKSEFEKWVNSQSSEETHQILYYYDFQNLTGSLQNLIQESRFLFSDFYKTLNENPFMLMNKPLNPDMVMFASGQIVTSIFSKINHLFINLSSQLDFITKIAYEIENLPNDFNHYPKLKAKKILYGDRKKIKNIDFTNTVFEKEDNIKFIINLRNEIIHNSSFENIPKVYQVFTNNNLVEKFILIPDNTNGIFDSYINRNRFFSTEIKLNEILPDLVTQFWKKMEMTVDKINNSTKQMDGSTKK